MVTTITAIMSTCRPEPNMTPTINGIPLASWQMYRPQPLILGHRGIRQSRANKFNATPAKMPETKTSKKRSSTITKSTSASPEGCCTECCEAEAEDMDCGIPGGEGDGWAGIGTTWWCNAEGGVGEGSLLDERGAVGSSLGGRLVGACEGCDGGVWDMRHNGCYRCETWGTNNSCVVNTMYCSKMEVESSENSVYGRAECIWPMGRGAVFWQRCINCAIWRRIEEVHEMLLQYWGQTWWLLLWQQGSADC